MNDIQMVVEFLKNHPEGLPTADVFNMIGWEKKRKELPRPSELALKKEL